MRVHGGVSSEGCPKHHVRAFLDDFRKRTLARLKRPSRQQYKTKRVPSTIAGSHKAEIKSPHKLPEHSTTSSSTGSFWGTPLDNPAGSESIEHWPEKKLQGLGECVTPRRCYSIELCCPTHSRACKTIPNNGGVQRGCNFVCVCVCVTPHS